MSGSDWQERYDRSVQATNDAIEKAKAERSTSEKIVDRSMFTGTPLDLILFPFVAIGHGVAALLRRRRNRATQK